MIMIPPRRRFADRHPFDRAFIAACLLAAAVILKDYKNPEAWATGIGIVAAAVSRGVRRNGTG